MVSAWDTLSEPSEAEMVAVVPTLTNFVEIAKVAEFLPPGITTFAGTVAERELLEILIVRPVPGAEPARVIVPVLVFPPVTEEGLRESAERLAGVMVIFTDLVTVPNLAVMVADVLAVTP